MVGVIFMQKNNNSALRMKTSLLIFPVEGCIKREEIYIAMNVSFTETTI